MSLIASLAYHMYSVQAAVIGHCCDDNQGVGHEPLVGHLSAVLPSGFVLGLWCVAWSTTTCYCTTQVTANYTYIDVAWVGLLTRRSWDSLVVQSPVDLLLVVLSLAAAAWTSVPVTNPRFCLRT